MAASEEDYKYLKRTGTAGVRGHLYETKLLSLIYFRLLHDDDIEEFYLGTNVDKLGSFDDICFRAKIKGCAQPLAVSIQAKHRENNSVSTLNSRTEMEKHFQSFLEIRKKLQPGNKDKLFEATKDETQCLCIIYTTANGDKPSTVYEGANAEKLNDLIATAAGATKPAHHRRDIDRLCTTYLEYQMRAFARKMAKCTHGEMKDYQELSTDDHVLQYHVIIAKNFFNISDEQINGFRTANFKEDFLDEEGERFLLRHFKEELCIEIIKRQKSAATCAGLDDCTFVVDDKDKVKDEDIAAMYHHISSSIIYKKKRFGIIHLTSSEKHNTILTKINSLLNRDIALKTAFLKCEFKVPAWFGNKDLTLRGDDKTQEQQLNDLTSKIVGLIRKSCGDRDPVATLADILVFPSVSGPVVSATIDDSMGKGFLQLSGGIASAVGNLLVQHPFSDQLIFTTEYDSLGPLAKRLYDKLQAELKNLTLYAFNIDVKHAFPKLSMIQGHIFDLKENAELFFDSLLFYTSQLDEKKVEETLIYEISQHLPDDVQNEEITSNAIYLKYHDNIQKWWMSKGGTYLSKTGTLYKDAVEHTTGLPLTSVMNMMETLKNKHYDFNENAIRSIPLAQQPAQTIILTDSTSLTVAKLAKQLNYKNFIVLDLKYILNLVAKDDKALREELTNLKESITIIMDLSYLLQKKNCLRSQRKFQELVKSIQRHKTVIVADQESIYLVEKYFPNSNNVVKDTTNNLIDMSEESRTHVLENTQVMFLGNEVTLSQVIDNKSIAYVVGSVFNKLMLGDLQTLTIGKSVHNSNYKKEMYLDRTLEDVEIQDRNEEIESSIDQKPSITASSSDGKYSMTEFSSDRKWSTRRRRDLFFGTPSQPSKKGTIRIRTRKYIDNKLKVLVGDAGIGKSTFLTHLSHEATKEQQDSWVLRINLIQHCQQFSEWQDSKKRIDVLESLKFLCQVALSKNHNNHEESGQVKIALEQSDYLFNKIRETDKIPNTWDLNMNLFDIYEGFLKTKLKIRVQEKNKNDLFTPDNKADFEEKYAKFMETHKKLGAYAVFGKTLLNEDQLKSIVEMVKDLKQDFLKTGVITNVVNNVPVFIHATFADYFAVEYICDLFKTDLDRCFIWHFILHVMFFSGNVGVLTLFDAKMKTNEELVALFKVDNEVVCDILLNQNVNGDIRSSLAEAVKHNLRAIGVFLCSAVADNLTATRLMDFIKIVKDTNIIITAIKMEFEVIIVEIVNLV
ncbi:hypothetical protein B5X24_HaOG212277 [Helicoverpa armigera]|uniref:NACHT domain-containing protein n=1 Tax=Helicoverpa armigera TaxID=29058 RepID=A0A2W1BGF3_HELAM|nr:hypothetical protein B5X24_HaOG212277 [Helicoverpa armigera]